MKVKMSLGTIKVKVDKHVGKKCILVFTSTATLFGRLIFYLPKNFEKVYTIFSRMKAYII